MGRLFARDVLGIAEPRVGLLSIGEEDVQGQRAGARGPRAAARARPGFAGNVEGRDILGGAVDVVVTDGFTGNVVLKTMEGTAGFLMGEVRAAVSSTLPGRVGGAAGPARRCGACASASTPRATAARCSWASAGWP